MKKALSLLLVAALVFGFSAKSYAGNSYASANAGIAWFDDVTSTPTENNSDDGDDDDSIGLAFDSGIALTGAFGYDYGSVRLEAEIGYQSNDVASVTETDGDDTNTEDGFGDVSLTTYMFNGYYDISPMDNSDVELFLTAGVGAVTVKFDGVGPEVDPKGGIVDEEATSNFSETTWAFQVGAGVAIPVGDGIMVDARYRYFDAADITSRDDDDVIDNDPHNISIDSHSALIGLRYNF